MVDLYLVGWKTPAPQSQPATVREMVARDADQTISVTFAVEYRVWQDLRQALMESEPMSIIVSPAEWQITETRRLDMGDQRIGDRGRIAAND